MTADSVLLLRRAWDGELAATAATLRRAGVPVLALSPEQLAAGGLLLDPAGGLLTVARRPIRPTVVWARHLPRPPAAAPDRPAGSAFAGESRAALARQLAAAASAALPGCAPEPLQQLRTATELGVRVPATLVATDPEAAPRQWRRVVLKALDRHFVEDADGAMAWFHPQLWDRRSDPPWPRPGVPALVQEYVAHEAEFRVYVVAGRVHAFRVCKQLPADIWLRPERVQVRAVTPPAPVARTALDLAAHWGLRYGAFDLLTDRGEPVFLEVNADGDWRWYEAGAGSRAVTMSAARALADLHRQHRGSGGGAAARPVGPVTFLTGHAWPQPPACASAPDNRRPL